MARPILILVAVVIACGTLCFASFHLAGQLSAAHVTHSTDELDWLRLEFHLNPSEMARIRSLHAGYLPRCQEYCSRIAEKRRALRTALEGALTLPADLEARLAEIAALRAQCQASMLRHFVDVSRAMPADQGRRYLAEMQELTLGSHEQIERQMSSDGPHPHGHH